MRPSNSTFGQPPSQANNIKKTQPSAPLQPQQQNKNFPNNNSYNNNSYNNNLQNKGPNNGNSGAVNRPPVSNNIPKSSNAIQKVNPIQSKTNAPMEQEEDFTPIGTLFPGMDFKIKARIINKSDVRTFTNQKGEGKLFSIDILDRQGQDCNCSFFGDAVD